MRVLIIGQGGRENALAWKLSQSPRLEKLYSAPGNTGMAEVSECVKIPAGDIEGLVRFAKEKNIDLTVVGPEAPLVEGLVDRFKNENLKVFGPDAYASQLEGSKLFSKRLMQRTGVPTATFEEFSNPEDALSYLSKVKYPLVVKADGLCAGKGVVIAQTRQEAEEAVKRMMQEKVFGPSGDKILIEECLEGEEASLIAVSDGETIVCFASSQDHKRIFDGDQGPNTGGMGAYSPAPVVSPQLQKEAEEKVFLPVIQALKEDGHPFVGFLYAGVMVTSEGLKVLEFNVRMGDPEAQAILPRLESDLLELFQVCLQGRLKDLKLTWRPDAAVCVVLASEGYPGSYKKGDTIRGISEAAGMPETLIFHAGTKVQDNNIVTDGGRVLNVVSLGDGIPQAVKRVYQAAGKITFRGMQFRKDIAHRALKRTAFSIKETRS